MDDEELAVAWGPGVVPVPQAVLEKMPELEEGVFRAAMFLCLAEKVSREVPAVVTVAEISAGTGIGVGRVQRALRLLARRQWVQRTDDGRWCWVRSIGTDPPERGCLGGEASTPPECPRDTAEC